MLYLTNKSHTSCTHFSCKSWTSIVWSLEFCIVELDDPWTTLWAFGFCSFFKGIWQYVQIFWSSDFWQLFCPDDLSGHHFRAFPGPQTTRDIKGGVKTVASDVAENYPHSPWQLIVGRWLIFVWGPSSFQVLWLLTFREGHFHQDSLGVGDFLLVDSVVSPTTPRWFASLRKNMGIRSY